MNELAELLIKNNISLRHINAANGLKIGSLVQTV